MFGKRIEDQVLITVEHTVEGVLILETICEDYDDYKSLPQLISYKEQAFAKTGWNSDKGYACYKPALNVGKSMEKIRDKVNDAHRLLKDQGNTSTHSNVSRARQKLHEVGVLLGMYTTE